MIQILMTAAALAGPIDVDVDGDHYTASLHMDAPAEAVRALVRDPEAVSRASGGRLEVDHLGPDGDCTLADLYMPTPLGRWGGLARICDTDDGGTVTLVRSRHFAEWAVAWSVTPDGDGTRVDYALDCASIIPLPRLFVRAAIVTEMRHGLAKLAVWTP